MEEKTLILTSEPFILAVAVPVRPTANAVVTSFTQHLIISQDRFPREAHLLQTAACLFDHRARAAH